MNGHLRNAVAWVGRIVALACLLRLVQGCFYDHVDWSSEGPGGGGEPGTKYFVLAGPPLRFQATPSGLRPELGDYGGGPHCVSLDQFEMRFRDLKGWAGDFVAVKQVHGHCAEIAIYCQGVVCQRYAFDYDAAGRARRRMFTEYELRREGESTFEWADRLKGRTPAAACASEIEYAWSEDGRTVEATLRAVHGRRQGREPISLPEPLTGLPGQKLETWQLNGQGLIASVVRDGKVEYSAQYDDAGRLLGYEEWGGARVENRYDAQGRLLETNVAYRGGRRGTIVHAYPGGSRADLPHLEQPGDAAWVVTHDEYGRVSRIREHAGPSDDIMSNTFEEFRRDKDGRIIWRRVGIAR